VPADAYEFRNATHLAPKIAVVVFKTKSKTPILLAAMC
jgi:hypothetical protein